MNRSISGFTKCKFLALTLLVLLACTVANADECNRSGDYGFICGPQNAEDLVLVPKTKWIISSSLALGGHLYLVDTKKKTWTEFYPAGTHHAQQDMETYAACPGSPDPDNFITHGLNIRQGVNGHSTLYVVGHGEREAIEVFDVVSDTAIPVLTWIGCVMLPEGMAANSVASFSDGSLVATVPLHPGETIGDAMAGQYTGGVYKWSPGDSEFKFIQGTKIPSGNGIEVSANEQEIYVASSGLYVVVAYSNSNPARQLRTTRPMEFIPDNLHMGSDGRLITAGLVIDDPVCGSVRPPKEFDLAEFAACPRPFIVHAIDPNLMEGRDLVRAPAKEQFSNVTTALLVDDSIWLGTFSGDRIGFRSMNQHD